MSEKKVQMLIPFDKKADELKNTENTIVFEIRKLNKKLKKCNSDMKAILDRKEEKKTFTGNRN